MITFLLDQGLPRSTVIHLVEYGIDAIHVGDIGDATATDAEILDIGRQQQRVVVTLDADFHTLLALSGATTPSAVRIRIEGLKGEALAELIQKVLHNCYDDLLNGAAVTVLETKIRIRKLPLIR